MYPDFALPEGHILDGSYVIEKVLGSGGFGITYRALDRELNRRVAIKEYFPRQLGDRRPDRTVHAGAASVETFNWGLEKFVQEAKTIARLRHPNIVRVFRTFEANNTAYIVFEYVEGVDMETWLKKLGRRPSQDELAALLEPLLDGLEVVHRSGFLHRDIKPANIQIRKSDGSPVLLDFGSARAMTTRQDAETEAMLVTPRFSPAEQYISDSSKQGPWSDIYGLAATAYRALTGEAPTDAMSRMLHDDVVPCVRDPGPAAGYHRPFLLAIDWGLAVRQSDRPQSVAEWRRSLFKGAGNPAGQLREIGAPRDQSPNSAPLVWPPFGPPPPGQPLDKQAAGDAIARKSIGQMISSWFKRKPAAPPAAPENAQATIIIPARTPNTAVFIPENPPAGASVPDDAGEPTLIIDRTPQTQITVMITPGKSYQAEVDRWIESSASATVIIQRTHETDVFLSYDHDDKAAVERLAKAMQAQGWRVFWDRTILPGDRWEDVIESAIENAKCVVVIWSARSVGSHWVKEEASLGRERGVLIPVMMEPTKIPLGFKSLQSADPSGWDGSVTHHNFQLLAASVRRQLAVAA